MPESRPGTYIVTTIVDGRRRLFQKAANAQLFIETLQDYRRRGYYKLHAFVVMPDHVHFLITLTGISLERIVGMIKGGFSHRLGPRTSVWQKGYTDHRCRDADEFRVRKEYIHMNPVRKGLVAMPELFPYSSAYRGEMPSAAEAAD